MSEFQPLVGTKDKNGLFRAMNDAGGSGLKAHFAMGFDPLAGRSEELYGITTYVFRGERPFAERIFTDANRDNLIAIMKSEEILRQMVDLTVEATIKNWGA